MDSNYSMQKIIMIAITLVVIAIILPIGLVYIGSAGDTSVTINNETVTLTEAVDPAIITLLTILLPILVVIVIIMYFLPRGRSS